MTALSPNHSLIADLSQLVDVEFEIQNNEARPDWGVGYLNGVKLEVECRKNGHWRIFVGYTASAAKREIIKEAFPCDRSTPCYSFDTFQEAAEFAAEVSEFIRLTFAASVAKTQGVGFEDTNFAGYGERDFMAAMVQLQRHGLSVIPGVGSNLGFEFQVPSTGSRIDAVEFDSEGSVVTVIECQSGIQHGDYLDDEHFAKAISRYPQSEEVAQTVRKIVVIAGGYSAAQLSTFAQLPYEIVALVTTVVDGKVVLAPAN